MTRDAGPSTEGDLGVGTPEQLSPGVRGRSFSSSTMTVHRYWFDQGARGVTHMHPEEQITIVESGSIEVTVGGRVHEMQAGEWIVVTPNAEHGLVAGADGAQLLCIVSPARAGSASPLSPRPA